MDYYGFKIDEYKSICYNPHMPVENEILLANIAKEGIDIGGMQYVNFIDRAPLSRPTLGSVATLCNQTGVGNYDELYQAQAQLPEGWIVKSLGTDNFKIIAVNSQLENTGIVIKRYLKKEWAWILFEAYKTLKEHFKSDELPILYPLARYGDCLIFPYLDLEPDCPDVKPPAIQLQQATRDIKLPGLVIAGKLRQLNLTNGGFVYSDIFPDDTVALQEAIESLQYHLIG